MEVVEGEERGDHGIIFKRVGPELCVVEGGFTTSIPSQALAISNKFGLTFFLHSEGFCLAKTQDLIQASQNLVNSDEKYNAKDNALASIHLPCTRLLALSEDELVVAACTEDTVYFYNIPALVEKGREGSKNTTALLKSLPILDEKPGIKLLAWNPGQRGVVLILSKGGNLTLGQFAEQHLKAVAEDVEAVDWSPDGEYLCYITSDKNLHICNSDLSSKSSSEIPAEMFGEAVDGGSAAYVTDRVIVDTLKWARSDSILVSCMCKDVDGEEDNSWIFVLVSNEGPIAKDFRSAKVVSFEGLFTSIDSSILPLETGPYTLSNYIQSWELLIIASRKSIDDHISLLGWVEELGQSEVYKFELLDDRFTPRIELQACGDDNCVLGLAVNKTTSSIEIAAPNGDSGEKLQPGLVLFCMTIEGNLSLFSIARTSSKDKSSENLNTILQLPEANEVLLSYNIDPKISSKTASGVELSQNKSKFEKTGLEFDGENETFQNQSGIPVPRFENAGNEQLPKHRTAVLKPAIGRKLGSQEKSKEPNREEMQAGRKAILSQRHAQVLVESNKRPDSAAAVTKTINTPVLSAMESEFLRELNKVKEMAKEMESLMEFIEGNQRQKKSAVEPSFTKVYVEDVERRTQTMYKQSQNFHEQMVEQRRSVIDLRDESLQVDAWRVYVQSVLEQAFDVRYQELWNKQTLHPELAGIRKRILEADQSLKQQIAELEEHLHNLELCQWQKRKQPNLPPVPSASKNFQSMQRVYDTINTQMVIAQQLERRLAMHCEALKLPAVTKEELESLVKTSWLKLQDMAIHDHPDGRARAHLSSSRPSDFSPKVTTFKNSLQTPSKPVPPAGARAGLQDSTRRRRDSVDKVWVDMGAAKTTVKRAAPAKLFDGLSSSSSKDILQAESVQVKNEHLYSLTGLHSRSGSRQVVTNIPTVDNTLLSIDQTQGPPTLSDEEETDETGNSINDFKSSRFADFGLGSSSSVTSQQSNTFGLGSSSSPVQPQPSTLFGVSSVWNQSSSSTSSVPAGQLLKTAISVPTPRLKTPPSFSTLLGNSPTSGVGGTFNVPGGFGSSAQSAAFEYTILATSSGEQGSGSALGSSAQTRTAGVSASLEADGRFASTATGGGFASAPRRGGFTGVGTGEDLLNVASGGGFAGVAAGGSFVSAPTGIGASASSNSKPSSFGAFSSGSFEGFRLGSSSAVTSQSSNSFGLGSSSSPAVSTVVQGSIIDQTHGPASVSDEDEMEEEGNNINDFEPSGFARFGLDSSSSVTSQRSNPFGIGSSLSSAASQSSSPVGASLAWNPSSPSMSSLPTGQLFKPAAFSIPTQQLTPPPSSSTLFGNNLASDVCGTFNGPGGYGSSTQPSAPFGNPTQASSSGQQALGSALGSFGQTRQIGGPFGVSASFGFTSAGGFTSAVTGGGFASAATSGGFAGAASSGGFAGVAAGGGFGSAATGGGFSGAGIGGPASSNTNSGGFGAFSGGAFSAFGGKPNSSIFTQMRK